MQNQPTSRFQKYQNIYFIATWVILVISVLLVAIGYIMVQSVVAAPLILVQLATVTLAYHVFHFFYGVFSLIYYFAKLKKRIVSTKIYKTVIGIFVSPVSAFIAYIAVFLITISACTAN